MGKPFQPLRGIATGYFDLFAVDMGSQMPVQHLPHGDLIFLLAFLLKTMLLIHIIKSFLVVLQ